jgi:hypothetical protein
LGRRRLGRLALFAAARLARRDAHHLILVRDWGASRSRSLSASRSRVRKSIPAVRWAWR